MNQAITFLILTIIYPLLGAIYLLCVKISPKSKQLAFCLLGFGIFCTFALIMSITFTLNTRAFGIAPMIGPIIFYSLCWIVGVIGGVRLIKEQKEIKENN